MNWIHKLIKRQNIKWLIRWHEKENQSLSMAAKSMVAAGEMEYNLAIETAADMKKPHREEITRLLKLLEEL